MVKKQIKRMKGRPRGGASVPCPACGQNTSVVITRRDDKGRVLRTRKCPRNHEFATLEKALAV